MTADDVHVRGIVVGHRPTLQLPRLTLSAVLEQLHDEAANQEVLGFRDELTKSPAGVIPEAIVTCFPHGKRHGHATAFLHHQPRCFESRFIFECGQDVGRVDVREFLHLFFTDRFPDYHSSVHALFL